MPDTVQATLGWGAPGNDSFTPFVNMQMLAGRTGEVDLAKTDSQAEVTLRADTEYFLEADLITYPYLNPSLRRTYDEEFQGILSLLADPTANTWKLKFPEGVVPLRIDGYLSPRREAWQSYLSFSYRNISRTSPSQEGWKPPWVLTDSYGFKFTVADTAGTETEHDVIFKAPLIAYPTNTNAGRYGQSKITAGARPFDPATQKVWGGPLADGRTPVLYPFPPGASINDGDYFIATNGAFGMLDLVARGPGDTDYPGSGPFNFYIRPTRRWRYDRTQWVEDTSIDLGVNINDTHIDADLSVHKFEFVDSVATWTEIPNVEISDVSTANVTVGMLDADESPSVDGTADGDVFISTFDYPGANVPVSVGGNVQTITPFRADARLWRWNATDSEWVFQQWIFGMPQTYENYVAILEDGLPDNVSVAFYDIDRYTYPFLFVVCDDVGPNVSIAIRDLTTSDVSGISTFRDFRATRWRRTAGGPHTPLNSDGGRWASDTPSPYYHQRPEQIFTAQWQEGATTADNGVLWEFIKNTDNPTHADFPIIDGTRISTVDRHGNAQMIDDLSIEATVTPAALGIGDNATLTNRIAAVEGVNTDQQDEIDELESEVDALRGHL